MPGPQVPLVLYGGVVALLGLIIVLIPLDLKATLMLTNYTGQVLSNPQEPSLQAPRPNVFQVDSPSSQV